MNHKETKHKQLGMNYSTASNRLVKDLLFNFIITTGNNCCFRCGEPMERSNFSIEHKHPWLHSEKPQEMFFDLNNISYSHLKCNVAAARKPVVSCGSVYKYALGCRCTSCTKAKKDKERKKHNPEIRKAKFKRTGH